MNLSASSAEGSMEAILASENRGRFKRVDGTDKGIEFVNRTASNWEGDLMSTIKVLFGARRPGRAEGSREGN